MKDQLPPPDPDPSQYVRPTQNWICGRAAEGQKCRIGPDAHGRCRATCECVPILEVKEGETKGRYKCTRPAEYGGPCENGPLPDGLCGRAIPPCEPKRSLRSRRTMFTFSVIIATVALLLLAVGGEHRWQFVSPGPLSSQHSGSSFSMAFANMHAGAAPGDPGCGACHVSARAGASEWFKTALDANPGPLRGRAIALTTSTGMTGIDQTCERCHLGHNFHEPNVVENHSCSACHQEHLGAGLLRKPLDVNCLGCHANASVMQASFEKGRALPLAAFDFRPDNGRHVFHAPRPEHGYTAVIHSFATDHPEFQVVREKLKDPDTLKFNHKLHLTAPTVAALTGKKLECVDCHKLDAAGHYHQKISFEQDCRVCHSLQFDAHNPGLTLPHGSPEFVRDFLRSLPAQYTDFAMRIKGLTQKDEVDAFVTRQMRQIRQQAGSGEELEQQVFLGDTSEGRARFPACTYCHEVTPVSGGVPRVTKPSIMDRWLIRGSFDHSKHLTIECARCHEVMRSTETSDVLLPSKTTCVACHSPRGGVADSCATCHSYHAPAKAAVTQTASVAQ